MPSVSIVRHGKGWRVVYREGGRGSKRGWTETRPSKREAIADAEVVRGRLLAAQQLGAGRVRLLWSEVVDRWAASRKPGRYRDEAVRYLKALPWSQASDATAAAIQAMPGYWQRAALSCLRWAVRLLDQPVDPRALSVPVKRKPMRPKTPLLADQVVSDVQREADEFAAGTGAMVHLISTYGHRAENLVAQLPDAVGLEAATLTLQVKGGDVVRHPLLPETVERLRPLVERGGPLFLNHLGKPWKDGRAFSSWFGHTFGFGYMDLRRRAITRMLAAGLDAKTVASITGHRTVSLLLNTYARTNEDRQRAAIETLASLNGVSPVSAKKSRKPRTRS